MLDSINDVHHVGLGTQSYPSPISPPRSRGVADRWVEKASHEAPEVGRLPVPPSEEDEDGKNGHEGKPTEMGHVSV